MKVLIVDDEPKILAYVCKGLGENGFQVDTADNGADAMFLGTTGDYDLIILDVMLPRANGWAVLTSLRNTGIQSPVLFLTACDSIPDRVKGLELGADDYVVKPFAFSELLARVRTLLRRGKARECEHFRIEDLEVDFARQRASRAGRRLDLTAKEFALLSLLIRRSGEILSRTVIAEQVWDMNFDSDTNVVDVAIRRLRSKVDDPFDQKLIHCARGRGYVLEPRTSDD